MAGAAMLHGKIADLRVHPLERLGFPSHIASAMLRCTTIFPKLSRGTQKSA
jgi:hypothetical protein